jgi:hypothetical protein
MYREGMNWSVRVASNRKIIRETLMRKADGS